MSRRLPLPRRFPKAPFIARLKLWTPMRSVAEIEGPYDDVAGELLLMVAVNAHPKGKDLKAMKECLDILKRKRRKR